MVSPLQYMQQYRNLSVDIEFNDPVGQTCGPAPVSVQLKTYFMMDWTAGTTQLTNYNAVVAGSSKDAWFSQNRDRIRTAAMGKGAPADYAAALQWAVYGAHIPNPSQTAIQAYLDKYMGIDCSGYATNFLIANGRKPNSTEVQRNTSAQSYFNPALAVNDPAQVRQGDLLVFMHKNSPTPLSNPGHIAVVESYVPQSVPGGNMRVVEATPASAANPKLVDSMYDVRNITSKGGAIPCMLLDVWRFGGPYRVAVIRI